MQHKEGTWEGFTAAYGCKRLLYFEGYEDIRTAIAGKNNAKAGGAKRSSTSFARSTEFKDVAQTWGWKMITVHEKMYP